MSLDRKDIPVTDENATDTPADQAAPAAQPDQPAAAAEPSTPAPSTADKQAADAPAPAATSTEPSKTSDTTKEVDIEGYKLKVDYDLVDDVENLELINKIEQGGYLYGIIEFLVKIVGQSEYDALKAHFVEKYGKLSLTKLGEIYQKIFEQFDPKG